MQFFRKTTYYYFQNIKTKKLFNENLIIVILIFFLVSESEQTRVFGIASLAENLNKAMVTRFFWQIGGREEPNVAKNVFLTTFSFMNVLLMRIGLQEII